MPITVLRFLLLVPLAAWSWAQSQPGEACRSGSRLFSERRYAEAQEPLWSCVIGGASNKEAGHLLVLTYRELKNYQQGWTRVRAELPRQPKSIDLLYIAGFLKFRLGEPKESIRLLGEAFQLDHYDWRVHQVFALNYVLLKIWPGALEELKTAVALNPRNAELYYELARLYYTYQARVTESIAASEKALALFPEYTEVYSNLGLCYEMLAQHDRARENYERAIALTEKSGSSDEWPYINYAAFLIKQGETERSLFLLDKALGRNPKSLKAHYETGRALRKLNRASEAQRYLEEAIRLDPDEPGAYFELGMLLNKQDPARSRQLLDRYKALQERERSQPAATQEGR
jgi:tetratricopeptide (TPR) repeat protein